MNLYPAILTDSPTLLAQQLLQVQTTPEISVVQIDIIDGYFADNLTLGPADLVGAPFGELQCDLHLMTEEPLDAVYEARDWKRDLPIRGVLAQVEKLSYQEEFLREVRGNNWRAGLSLNLYTPLEAIDDASWDYLDSVQIMAIEAGFQGQHFSTSALEIIAQTAAKIAQTDRSIELLVDGGIKLDLIDKLTQLGVDGVAVGSALWQAPDFSQAVAEFSAS